MSEDNKEPAEGEPRGAAATVVDADAAPKESAKRVAKAKKETPKGKPMGFGEHVCYREDF